MTATQSAYGVRPPAVAGAFYPANPATLTQQIDGYLAQAERLEPEPSIIIVPHAGYVFSGGVAAHGFKQALDRGYEHVIILGFNHGYAYSFDGAAVWPDGAWRTPLGEVPIDEPLAQAILKAAPVFTPDRSIHLDEHSLEVEVPFIQRVLPGVPIVPISIGKPTLENAQAIAAGLARVLSEFPHTLVVTSTDLSHYPRYQDALRVDQSSIQAVVSLDPLALEAWDEEAMSSRTANLHTTMCGKGPVMVSMLLARAIGAEQVHVLKYANSGDVPEGEKDRVVGYAAIEFVKGQPPALSAEDKITLLKLARTTLDEYLQTRTRPHFDTDFGCHGTAARHVRHAAPQTDARSARLPGRGLCALSVVGKCAARQRAQRHRRSAFQAHERMRELADMHIEISVLTPMRLAHSPEEVIVGQHGVMIRAGGRGGLFLPQVPVEQGWDHDEYLSTLCWMKAGLPADAWRKPNVQLYIFEAEIFEE